MNQHDKETLREATARTLEHYNQRAEGFWQGTRDHDVSQNIEAFLSDIVQYDDSVHEISWYGVCLMTVQESFGPCPRDAMVPVTRWSA